MKDPRLVSIITSSYNSQETIVDTLESVLNQTYSPLEYLIIDGGSTDNTMEYVYDRKREFEAKRITLKIVSEKDDGIADAWNKGLEMATGEVIGLLNSDDYYETTAVEKVMGIIDPDAMEVTYGICKRIDKDKNLTTTINGTFNKSRIYLNFGFSHTTCFVTKKVYDNIGNFDKTFKIGLDVDFLLRCLKNGVSFIKANNWTYMRSGGISLTFEEEAVEEHKRALIKNGYSPFLAILFAKFKKLLIKLK